MRRDSCPPPSARSTSACSLPLVHTTLPPSGARDAGKVGEHAAGLLHDDLRARRGPTATPPARPTTSTTPSATIMCDQKSPNARVRHTDRVRSRKPVERPCSSQPVRLERTATRRDSVGHRRHVQPGGAASGCARSRRRRPRAAHQRRFSAGADTTPTTISSSSISAISVAQTGHAAHEVLRGVDRVDDPAARLPYPVLPYSSPSTASRGRARLQRAADLLLDAAVGVGDRRQVRLRLDCRDRARESAWS